MKECTIITVCLNCEESIEKTIKSVLSQNVNMERIEYLFIDGLSSDNTIKIIKKYIDEYPNVNIRYISEKDKGIYDAMNKGAKLASGQWCLYLNAGDTFFNENSLNYLINVEKKDKYDIIYGDTIYKYKDKYNISKSRPENELTYMNGMEFCHQSCIIKKEYQCKHLYSLDYKIAGDCDFFTRTFIFGAKFLYVNEIISFFSMDGISSTNGSLCIKENLDIKLKYNLINKDEYEKKVKKLMMKIQLRKVIPKKIIQKRHNILWNKKVKDWYSYSEILGEVTRNSVNKNF